MNKKEKDFLDAIGHKSYVKKAWDILNKKVGQKLRPCCIFFSQQSTGPGINDSEIYATLIWEKDGYYISLDIFRYTNFEWFILDKNTKVVISKEEKRTKKLPEELLKILRKYCTEE